MGESIAEGTIVKWLKKVGETVQRDEPLLEISTDKVDAEIPSPAAGTLTEILAKEGETVHVNSVIARLSEACSRSGACPAAGRGCQNLQPVAAAPTPPPPARSPASSSCPTAGCGPVAAARPSPKRKKVRSSPLVRNIARENDVDLDQVPAPGLADGSRKDDILGFIASRKAPGRCPAPASVPAVRRWQLRCSGALRRFRSVPTHAAGERVRIEPLTTMRRRIAENMLNSRRTSAHVTTYFEVDFTNIARLRDRMQKGLRGAKWRQTDLHAFHHQGGRRRAEGLSDHQRLGRSTRISSTSRTSMSGWP
jgi:2-oxoglutarate dehydrogenase E2 component (dihydrolipoamide succinyltransferase)